MRHGSMGQFQITFIPDRDRDTGTNYSLHLQYKNETETRQAVIQT